MRKKRFFKTSVEAPIFTDIEDGSSVYATTAAGHNRYFELRGIHQEPSLIPDHKKIKAFVLSKVEADDIYDYYDIVNKESFDFPVNRINWTTINFLPK